jgi:hypothetical protein
MADSNGTMVMIAVFVIVILIGVYYFVIKGKGADDDFGGTYQEPNFPDPTPTKSTEKAVAEILNKPTNENGEWMELVKKMELDPSITSWAFNDWRGLRRPSHVNVGASARQVPDIDETVLQRNKPFRFN